MPCVSSSVSPSADGCGGGTGTELGRVRLEVVAAAVLTRSEVGRMVVLRVFPLPLAVRWPFVSLL